MKKIHVAILYNEPTVTTPEGKQFVTSSAYGFDTENPSLKNLESFVDMSEAGVVDEMNDIKRALLETGFTTTLYNVNSDIIKLINFLTKKKPDVVFNICESIGNEAIHEVHVAGIYELLKIPYTGAPPMALGLALNKAKVKDLLLFHGLPTPKYQLFDNPENIKLKKGLKYPLIVKPSQEDASVGISSDSVVYNIKSLKEKVQFICSKFHYAALVEEYIDGRELNVALLGNHNPVTLPISEIDMSTLPSDYHKIITYNAKWMKGSMEYENTKGKCPAKLPKNVEKKIKELALKAYKIVGCRDYARVDFRLTKSNKPYILEVNPNPDIAADAGFARSAKAAGYTFGTMIKSIVDLAFERRNGHQKA